MATRVMIIGAGPGGYVAAIRAAQLGADVTVVEQSNVGGTCLNRGCIPSKIMRKTADLLDDFSRAAEFGISANSAAFLDMPRIRARQQEIIKTQADGILRLFKAHKINYLKGRAFIKNFRAVGITFTDGTTTDIAWDRLILALGSRPLSISAFPFDSNKIISSDDALALKEVPESLLIVGGGVIGCEFAFIFSSFGSKVTLVEAMSRILPLPSVDTDCSTVLQREMKKHNISYLLNQTLTKVKENGEKLAVTLGPSSQGPALSEQEASHLTPSVDKILVCIGRKPNTDEIGIERLGIKMDPRGWIITDQYMRTNVDNVYAIGDVLGPSKAMFAHVASTEGLVSAENAMGGTRIMDYTTVPAVVFTQPEVATVGLTEEQALQQGFDIHAETVLFRSVGKAHVVGKIAGHIKIVSEAKNGRVLGVHLVGPHAAGIIAEGTLVVKMKGTVGDLAETIHAHPTLSEIVMEASLKALGRPVHG